MTTSEKEFLAITVSSITKIRFFLRAWWHWFGQNVLERDGEVWEVVGKIQHECLVSQKLFLGSL